MQQRASLVALRAVAIWVLIMHAGPAALALKDALFLHHETHSFPLKQSIALNFFLHDNLLSGPDSSAITVVPPVAGFNSSLQNQSFFGAIIVLDDSITYKADPSSLELGRGRGFYVWDAMNITGPGIQFVFTAVFNEASGYGGSSLSFQGHDVVVDRVRELSITGGTGRFRLARGWATIYTHSLIGGAAILNITAYIFTGC
ncbi:hypothetical protein O6H91_03G068300 [Diphasiastrum complanatum]|uniref:Uncharacterized protein n=1 Tax=Diphasiastrum complanatum TaxID=34168 RepID=A0ACC2E7G7_DIPCM|nr:hypothetical protein O6H91_03G068300 [Diphasiastrum complanatum]